MKLVTADQMRALEQRADQSGNTFAIMMERAGTAVADALIAALVARGTRQNHVLVLVGPGNNGGDGLVCARSLYDRGADVTLYIWKRATHGDDPNLRLCFERDIPTVHAEQDADFGKLKELVAHNSVIVDALLGTGVTRPIQGQLKDLLETVRVEMVKNAAPPLAMLTPPVPGEGELPFSKTRPFVAAVDLPSGLNPDTGALDPATLPADLTVTFAFPKVGQVLFPGAGAVGQLVVADIGIPSEWAADVQLEAAGRQDVARLLPERPLNSNKGTFGKAMICAGSENYVGAAYLAGSACTRAGAGLVTVALARVIHPIIAASLHEATYVPLPDADGALVPDAVKVLVDALQGYGALLIGCGFGRRPQTVAFVQQLLASGRLPRLVIDADALYALSQTPGWSNHLEPNTAILTPHPGEMSTLCGMEISAIQAERVETTRRFAAEWRQVLVLKGAQTVVGGPDGRVMLIPFATPALATAGTGDVLAGTMTALLAQKLEPFEAAVVGTYLHGLAGKIAEKEIGRAGAVASDLLPRLPVAMNQLRAV